MLAGWAASVLRFREDANAEEALALGGYADRVLVELLANGVDAAREAGVPARVRLRWHPTQAGPELRVANVGAALTAAGVAGLATLRASAKRETGDTVGHFGVGFTAVRAVTDAVQVISSSGSIAFDLARTAVAIAELASPALDVEVSARAGQLPMLRLPWAVPEVGADPLPAEWTTEVRLRLRPDAVASVRAQLAAAGPELFFALPGLTELLVEDERPRAWTRTDSGGGSRPDGDRITLTGSDGQHLEFATLRRSGLLPADLLADRPVEERGRTGWWLQWVRPISGGSAVAAAQAFGTTVGHGVVGAPTATDEPLSLPAALYGTFPVDDTRRRLAPGPLTEHLLDLAAHAYVELVAAAPAETRLALVPAGEFPLGPVDSRLRQRITDLLATAPVWRTALGDVVSAAHAVLVPDLPPAAETLLAQALPGLLPTPTRAGVQALRRLGADSVELSAAVSTLAGLHRPPAFWHAVYDALAESPTEALAGIVVPLAAGGQRIGARSVLLPVESGPDGDLLRRAGRVAPDLAVVDPDAAHPLLLRLGAQPADADALLSAEPLVNRFGELRDELEDVDPDPDEVVELAVLALDLVAAGGRATGGVLDHVVLTDDSGSPWPARDLLIPGGVLNTVLAPDAALPEVGTRWTRDFTADQLAAVGVRSGLPVVTVTAESEVAADLPDVEDWLADRAAAGPMPGEFVAIADLDLIDDEAWPQVLGLIAADPAARAAVQSADSYTGWWLRRNAVLDGRPVRHWRRRSAPELLGLYDELPVELDAALAVALGVPGSVAEAAADDPAELLRRYADPDRTVPPVAVPALTAAVVRLLAAAPDLPLPTRVRTADGAAVSADRAVVLDLPWFAALVGPDEAVPGGSDPQLVADVLDLETAASAVPAALVAEGSGERAGSAGAVGNPDPAGADGEDRAQLRAAAQSAAAALGVAVPSLVCRPQLTVESGGSRTRVAWWPLGDGFAVDGSPAGVGRAVAWSAGRWSERFLAVAAAGADRLVQVEGG